MSGSPVTLFHVSLIFIGAAIKSPKRKLPLWIQQRYRTLHCSVSISCLFLFKKQNWNHSHIRRPSVVLLKTIHVCWDTGCIDRVKEAADFVLYCLAVKTKTLRSFRRSNYLPVNTPHTPWICKHFLLHILENTFHNVYPFHCVILWCYLAVETRISRRNCTIAQLFVVPSSGCSSNHPPQIAVR